MRMQLIAKVADADLLRKSMHELGTVVYLTDENDNIVRVVYFSSSRIVEYFGKVDEALAKCIKAIGHKVNSIEIDEVQGFIRIEQQG
ncbi:MAG: hypothetical protein QXQ50_03910 [Candidatus Bathyarchaeia archaeon]